MAGFVFEKVYRDASFASVVSLRISLGGIGVEWNMSIFLCYRVCLDESLKALLLNSRSFITQVALYIFRAL